MTLDGLEAAARHVYDEYIARSDFSVYPPGSIGWEDADEAERQQARETAAVVRDLAAS